MSLKKMSLWQLRIFLLAMAFLLNETNGNHSERVLCSGTQPLKCYVENTELVDFNGVHVVTIDSLGYEYVDNYPRSAHKFDLTEDVLFMTFGNMSELCMNISAEKIPVGLMEHAEYLHIFNISWNHIRMVSTNVFANATQLKLIDLSHNYISEIEDNAFIGLKNLKRLLLSGNRLKTLRTSTFSGLLNIESIDLNSNAIEDIEDGTFGLPTLLTLDLKDNQLKRLSSDLCAGAISLRFISLTSNPLTHVNHVFEKCQRLSDLFLFNNTQLIDINLNYFAQLPQLEKLFLNVMDCTMDTTIVKNSESKLNTLVLMKLGSNWDEDVINSVKLLFPNLTFGHIMHANYTQLLQPKSLVR